MYGRRPISIAVAGALLLGVVPATAGAAEPGGKPTPAEVASAWWPNVKDVAGRRLAELEIFRTDGALLEDSVIIASLWPKREVRDALEPGDKFRPVPIDRATVSKGRATVDVDDEALLRAHTSKGGEVKVQLDVFTEGGRTIFFLESRADASGRWSGGPGASLAGSAAALHATDNSAVTRFDLDPEGLSPADLPPEAVISPLEARDHHDQWGCSDWDASSNITVPETIGTSAVYNGIKMDMTYTSSATTVSELGIQGANGIWKVSGSMTRGSTLTADFNQVVGSTSAWTNKEYRAGYVHHRYWAHCPLWENGIYNGKYYTQRTTEPYKVASFPAIINSRYSLPGCVTKQSLTGVQSISTTTQRASSYSAAFAIPYGGATFSGGARSDYSSSVKYKFTRPTTSGYWYWCGDTSVPQDSYRVRAGR